MLLLQQKTANPSKLFWNHNSVDTSSQSPQAAPRPVKTVLGDKSYEMLGITDAHNHVWIGAVPGVDAAAPVLDQFEPVKSELRGYRAAGGGSLLDCQPGGCGRDANQLVRLSKESGVNLIACTGFHRKKYYPPNFWLFTAPVVRIADYLISECNVGFEESRGLKNQPRAGFLKIALEAEWKDTPQAGLEAAAVAAAETGVLLQIHTEKGQQAEKAVLFFTEHGVKPQQLVLCHMDKRPDFSLHAELCRFGVLMEYDTFYRPKYEPEKNLWPLILAMVKAGLSHHVTLATDMAEAEMYKTIHAGPGLASLPGAIQIRLDQMEIPLKSIQEMLGGNIARRLAGLN